MITFENVTKRYPGGTVAVDHLNLEVPDGQTMVLVGPSGCGKTTSLRMINRMIDPTEGRIVLDGHDIQRSNPAILRRGIGYVIQQAGLFPHRTIEDNIATVPMLTGWQRPKARARARELMELVGLDASMARRYPYQLSGGQQQRVGVARALAADPPVLLMDEPFSAVDPIVRNSLQDELLRLQAELHKTVVLVTHDIEEAIKVGDQVALFQPGGTLVQVAAPQELLANPANSYVEDFLGFDRGIRRLSFLAAGALDLDGSTVVADSVTAGDALATAHGAGVSWLLVTDGERRPRGWASLESLQAAPSGQQLAQVDLASYGHTFRVDTDSLRAALDATVLSPTGQAVGVDGDGRVAGVTSYERLRTAIQQADEAKPSAEGVRAPMSWISQNVGLLGHLIGSNAFLALIPVLIGLAISIPLGIMCVRWGWLYAPLLSLTSILYALPALAVFVILVDYTGLTNTTVMIPLTVYTLAVLLPAVVDGLRSVPGPVRQAATAMGFGTWRRIATVELPIAVPVIIAGLRVAAVSSISLVSVGELIGVGGLGYLLEDGQQRDFNEEIYVGIVLIVLLALVTDVVLVFARWALTPWQRGRSQRTTRREARRAALAGRTGGEVTT